jgi:ribosomal 50S subunit-associated protein YjgA (DUF615 family)
MVREIQEKESCSEERAMDILLDSYPDINRDTLKTYIRRAKQSLTDFFGRKPSPVVQKTAISEF